MFASGARVPLFLTSKLDSPPRNPSWGHLQIPGNLPNANKIKNSRNASAGKVLEIVWENPKNVPELSRTFS